MLCVACCVLLLFACRCCLLWFVVVCCYVLLFVVRCVLVVVRCSFFVCLWLVDRRSLFVVRWVLCIGVCCWLVVVRCSLFAVVCYVFVVVDRCCWLLSLMWFDDIRCALLFAVRRSL